MYLYLCILICMCAMLPMTMKPSCTVFQIFFRGEKDFSILDALHFFHTLEVFLELFGAEVVLVYKSTLVDVCFLLSRLVQSSSFVAVIDACQSAARPNSHVHSDSVPVHPAHFQHPLNLFIQSFLFSLPLTLSVIYLYLSHI